MKMALTVEETKLHHKACVLARQHRETETSLCQVLREIGRTQLYLKLGYARLFTYAVEELKLTKAVAYAAIAVARKTETIPEFKAAVDEKRLSVAKASRLVSCLSGENAAELIAYALTHNFDEIDEEVARRNPEKPKRDHSRPIGNDKVALSGQVTRATHQLMSRAKSLLASKGKPTHLDSVLKESLEAWLDRHDPLRKAERAQARRAKEARRFECNATESARPETAAQPAPEASVREDESSNAFVEQSTSALDDQVSSLHFGQEAGARVEQSASIRAEQNAHSRVEKRVRVRVEQSAGTLDHQGSPAHSEQEPSFGSKQKINLRCENESMADPEEKKWKPSSRTSSGSSHVPSTATKFCAPQKTSMNHQANTPPSQNHTARRPKRQRRPLKAWTRHEVTLQTGDCCTFVNERGERCAEERWLHRHHIVSLSQGGTDEASNITLLCSAHHSLVHQLSLALDGQITWLRSPQAVYLSGPPRHHGRSFGGGPGRADLANRHWSLVAAEME